GHGITDLAAVLLVMRRVLLGAADELLVDRVHHAAPDAGDHRLLRLVADHDPVEDAPGPNPESPTTPNASSDCGRAGRGRRRAAPAGPGRCSRAGRSPSGSAG